MKVSREEWAKRIERWKDSGLTAKQFAGELGINPRTLVFWKWHLNRQGKRDTKPSETAKATPAEHSRTLPLMELTSPVVNTRFELELAGGRRLTIPERFDTESLRRLLAVLEGAT